MTDSINRITNAFSDVPNDYDVVERMTQKSYLISSDMAHGIHPNYTGKHAKNHGPKFHEGVVIKTNVNQRYATNAITSYIFKEFARRASVDGIEAKIQEFVVRQDMGCGSTIGPIVASGTGIRTIDVGCPQWSMHRYDFSLTAFLFQSQSLTLCLPIIFVLSASAREVMGTDDVIHAVRIFRSAYLNYTEIDAKLESRSHV